MKKFQYNENLLTLMNLLQGQAVKFVNKKLIRKLGPSPDQLLHCRLLLMQGGKDEF